VYRRERKPSPSRYPFRAPCAGDHPVRKLAPTINLQTTEDRHITSIFATASFTGIVCIRMLHCRGSDCDSSPLETVLSSHAKFEQKPTGCIDLNQWGVVSRDFVIQLSLDGLRRRPRVHSRSLQPIDAMPVVTLISSHAIHAHWPQRGRTPRGANQIGPGWQQHKQARSLWLAPGQSAGGTRLARSPCPSGTISPLDRK
jgi:hypothetical protein